MVFLGVCDVYRRNEVSVIKSVGCYSEVVSIWLQGDYLLVDLNPFSPPTDPLLFDWEELRGWAGPSEVRLVEDGCVQPSPLQVHRLPQVRRRGWNLSSGCGLKSKFVKSSDGRGNIGVWILRERE